MMPVTHLEVAYRMQTQTLRKQSDRNWSAEPPGCLVLLPAINLYHEDHTEFQVRDMVIKPMNSIDHLELGSCIEEGMIPYGLFGFPIHEASFFDWSSKHDFSEILAVVQLTSDPNSLLPIPCDTVWYDLTILGLWVGRSKPCFDGETAIIDHKGLL